MGPADGDLTSNAPVNGDHLPSSQLGRTGKRGIYPTSSQEKYYTQVRQIFAQAIAAGTAAVPFHGRMIDVPVDEWAKVVLDMAAACATRDAQKCAAQKENKSEM